MKFSNIITIGDKAIGPDCPAFIVAEAGVAHFGSLEKALKLVDMAVDAGADAVKFQTYKTEKFINPAATELFERYKSKELPYEAFYEIKQYCEDKGIIFFSTAHEEESLDFLVDLDVPLLKVGSGEIGNWDFIEKVVQMGLPVILSTGMYNWMDILNVVKIFREVQNPNLVLMHCVTKYPCPPNDVNLKAINEIKKNAKTNSGYSDHTDGILFPVMAAALGASVIEKHISLDFDIPGANDWKVSCGGEYSLKDMIRDIRKVEMGMGRGDKTPLSPKEYEKTRWARKNLKTGLRPE